MEEVDADVNEDVVDVEEDNSHASAIVIDSLLDDGIEDSLSLAKAPNSSGVCEEVPP